MPRRNKDKLRLDFTKIDRFLVVLTMIYQGKSDPKWHWNTVGKWEQKGPASLLNRHPADSIRSFCRRVTKHQDLYNAICSDMKEWIVTDEATPVLDSNPRSPWLKDMQVALRRKQ